MDIVMTMPTLSIGVANYKHVILQDKNCTKNAIIKFLAYRVYEQQRKGGRG
jgi:hypothetical protein